MRYFRVLVVGGLFLLAACSEDNAQYYRSHPKELQEVIKNCPDVHPKHINCDELAVVAQKVNFLAYQLQRDPQEFGNKILIAQEKLARHEALLKKDKTKSSLFSQIQQEKQQIVEYLAVVKWLESPEK